MTNRGWRYLFASSWRHYYEWTWKSADAAMKKINCQVTQIAFSGVRRFPGQIFGPWNAGKPADEVVYWTAAATSKVLYGDDDHVITYQCYDGRRLPGNDCEFSSAAVLINSRRRAVNTVQQRIIDVAARLSCFSRNEFIFLQQPGMHRLTRTQLLYSCLCQLFLAAMV